MGGDFFMGGGIFIFYVVVILMRRVDSFIAYGVPLFFNRMAQPYHGMGDQSTVPVTLSRLSLYTFTRS